MKNFEKPRTIPELDDYYMGMSFWIAAKSKDPKNQVGAYIVGDDDEPISFGYNGPPTTINDQSIDWVKYNPLFHHAEDNAIWRGRHKELLNATIYITARPCNACMLDIVRSGIRRVVYCAPKILPANDAEWKISTEIAKVGKVILSEFGGSGLNWMRDRMKWMESVGVFD